LRVSTDQQATSGLGLEAQQAAVTVAAKWFRLALEAVFVDAGTSGSLSRRIARC
jgi:DNA invertase Pin-like site-specific DNA recombinase